MGKNWRVVLAVGLLIFSFVSQVHARHLTATDSVSSRKVKFSIYPVLGYQPRTSISLGLISFIVYDQPAGDQLSTYHRPSAISPYLVYTFNKQMLLASSFDLYFGNHLYLYMKPRYYTFPDFYYGIGDDSRLEAEEIYTNVYPQLEGRFMKFLNNKWSIGVRFDMQYNHLKDFDPDGQLIQGNVFGTQGGFNSGLGPSVLLDTRDDVLYPAHGYYFTSEITFYTSAFGGRYNYIQYLVDLRKYITVINEQNILAFQIAGNFSSGADVPFYKLQKVGGSDRLRGIQNANLYMDRQSFWTQAEYRRPLFWRFGGVAFAGLGGVAPSLAKVRFDKLKYVVGLGGRFRALKSEKLNVRLDAGLSNGGQYAFYLSVKEAF